MAVAEDFIRADARLVSRERWAGRILPYPESPDAAAHVEWAARVSEYLETLTAEERIDWALAARGFHGRIIASTGFGPQSAVVMNMVPPDIIFVDVDTRHRYEASEDYKRLLMAGRFNHLNLKTYSAPETRLAQLKKYGDPVTFEKGSIDLKEHFRRNKEEPMARALRELNVLLWINGRRREHNHGRGNLPVLEFKDGLYRLNPIVDWSNRQVYEYLKTNDLPQHPLGKLGYNRVGEYFQPLSLDKGECGIFGPGQP